MSKKILEDLQAKLEQIFASSPARDLERNIRAVMTQAVSRLDVATKEEYEAQKLNIMQIENKMQSLEVRIAEIEKKLRKAESQS